jgi:hypothetical protein
MKRGNCYVTSEALFHLLGGKTAGWTAMRMPVPGDMHWFLRHKSGLILDATAQQFIMPLDYSKAVATGFLTSYPSARAAIMMDKMLWSSDDNIGNWNRTSLTRMTKNGARTRACSSRT